MAKSARKAKTSSAKSPARKGGGKTARPAKTSTTASRAAAPAPARAKDKGKLKGALFQKAETVRKAAHATMSLGGDKSHGLYRVTRGRAHVRLLTGDRVFILEPLEEGSMYLNSGSEGIAPNQIDLVALESFEAAFVPMSKLQLVTKKDSEAAGTVLALQQSKNASYVGRLRDLALGTTDYRLARFLYEQVPASQRGSRKSVGIQLDVSREEIAALIGTVREVVSRGLSKLVAEGVIRKQGRNFTVLKMKDLARRAVLR